MESIFERIFSKAIGGAISGLILSLFILIVSFIWRKSKLSIFALWKIPQFKWWIIFLIPYLLISKTVISLYFISDRYSSYNSTPLQYDQDYIISNPSIDDYLYLPLLCLYTMPLVYFFVKNKDTIFTKIKDEKSENNNVELDKVHKEKQELEYQKLSANENKKIQDYINQLEQKNKKQE